MKEWRLGAHVQRDGHGTLLFCVTPPPPDFTAEVGEVTNLRLGCLQSTARLSRSHNNGVYKIGMDATG